MSKFFARNDFFTDHASQHIIPFIKVGSEFVTRDTYNSKVKNLVVHSSDMTHTELHLARNQNTLRYTPSYNLSQSRLLPSYMLSFIFIRATSIISYLANIWSQMRHMFCNTFDFRNMKPRYESVEETDGVIIPYSKPSEVECETQCIAEWGDAKYEPFVGLFPKPFSHQDRLENKKLTFDSNMCDQIDKKVDTTSDRIELSSTPTICENDDDILEGEGSVKVTMKTPSTGGQQANPMIDDTIVKESKGRSKRKSRKPKVTFAQLLEKYQKINEAKSVYRPIVSNASRSPPRRKSKDRYWQRDNLDTSYSHPYCGLPIPVSWVPP